MENLRLFPTIYCKQFLHLIFWNIATQSEHKMCSNGMFATMRVCNWMHQKTRLTYIVCDKILAYLCILYSSGRIGSNRLRSLCSNRNKRWKSSASQRQFNGSLYHEWNSVSYGPRDHRREIFFIVNTKVNKFHLQLGQNFISWLYNSDFKLVCFLSEWKLQLLQMARTFLRVWLESYWISGEICLNFLKAQDDSSDPISLFTTVFNYLDHRNTKPRYIPWYI